MDQRPSKPLEAGTTDPAAAVATLPADPSAPPALGVHGALPADPSAAPDPEACDGGQPRGSVGPLHRVKWVLALIAIVVVFVVGQAVGIGLGASLAAFSHAVRHGTGTMSEAAIQSLVDEGLARGLSSATVEGQLAMLVGQLTVLALIGPLWLWMRRRAFMPLRARSWSRRDAGRIAGALVVGGIGFQFAMSPVLSLLSQVFVQTFEEYGALMERALGDAALVEFISIVVLAPLLEEVACRGAMLECGLRALLPWSRERGARGIGVDARTFWTANFLQALAFAVMHGNVVQTSYALVFGMALAWVCWRTGRLRYAVLLHMAVNGSSYLLSAFELATAEVLGPLAFLFVLALIGVGCLAASWRALKPLLGAGALRMHRS